LIEWPTNDRTLKRPPLRASALKRDLKDARPKKLTRRMPLLTIMPPNKLQLIE
jgi:hypothetical protein